MNCDPGGRLEHGVGAVALHHGYSGAPMSGINRLRAAAEIEGPAAGPRRSVRPCLVSAREGFGGLAGDLFLAVREPREPRLAGSTVRRAKVVVVGPVVVQNSL
jgi:hypothetical protein